MRSKFYMFDEIVDPKKVNKKWPMCVIYSERWLDGNTYRRRDQLIEWLEENEINFKYHQDHKTFLFAFKREEDRMLFVLRWG